MKRLFEEAKGAAMLLFVYVGIPLILGAMFNGL
ncbi:hypothetical protein [Rhizobium phage RHph_X2_28B]|nr:hypothetical protein PP751_gp010 [Rhizobium phage RHph_X2_28B]QWY83462.1 hypothetical protein [Rhizobium phage RHph_X2_28B]QWY83698.1 hypothetical protein [Rhizobium phage RHph_X3_15]